MRAYENQWSYPSWFTAGARYEVSGLAAKREVLSSTVIVSLHFEL